MAFAPRPSGSGGPRKQFIRRKKVCKFCVEKSITLITRNPDFSQFVPERENCPGEFLSLCTPSTQTHGCHKEG
jgi:hypothetical protein